MPIRPNDNNGQANLQNPNNPNSNLNLQDNYGNQIRPIGQNYGNQQLRPGQANNFNKPQPGSHLGINQNIYDQQANQPGAQNPFAQQPTNHINHGANDNPGNPQGVPNIYGTPTDGLYNTQQNPNAPQYPTNGGVMSPGQGYPNNQYQNPQNPAQVGAAPGQSLYGQPPNQYPQSQQPNPYLNNGNGNGFGGANAAQQCPVRTSVPPDPASGCCGQDMSDSDRITGNRLKL